MVGAFPDVSYLVLPSDIRDELCLASLLLGVAVGNIRWPVSPTVSATDATPDSGGTTRTDISVDLAEHLYQACEYTGSHVRLDEGFARIVPAATRRTFGRDCSEL